MELMKQIGVMVGKDGTAGLRQTRSVSMGTQMPAIFQQAIYHVGEEPKLFLPRRIPRAWTRD